MPHSTRSRERRGEFAATPPDAAVTAALYHGRPCAVGSTEATHESIGGCRPVPRARRGAQPLRRGARCRRPRPPLPPRSRAGADEDDTGPASARRWATSTSRSSPPGTGEPLFFCAHLDTVPPVDAIEPVVEDGSVRKPERRDSRRRQQGRSRRDARGRPARPRGEPPARGDRAPLHVQGGGRAARARTRSTTARLRARSGYVYDQAEPIGGVIIGRAVGESGSRSRSTAARPTPGMYPGGRPVGDRRRRARDRRDAARPDRRGDDREHRHDQGGSAAEHRPGVVPLVGEARSHDERKLAEQVQAMQDAITFAAGVAECEVETNIEQQLPRLPLQARRHRRPARDRGARPLRLRADATRCRAAPRTRTSSTSAACSA